MRRKYLFLSLSILIVASALFLRPQPASGKTCTGTCSWYICVYIPELNGNDVCTWAYGTGWVDQGTVNEYCELSGSTCECTAPSPGFDEEFLLYHNDCPVH